MAAQLLHHLYSIVDVSQSEGCCERVEEKTLEVGGHCAYVHCCHNQEERKQQPVQSRAPCAAHLANN